MIDSEERPAQLTVVRYQDVAVPPRRASSEPPAGSGPEARRCLVYRNATGLGHWLYPPFDADAIWDGERFHVECRDPLGEQLWRGVMMELVGFASTWWCSQLHGILQIDPGLIFVTRPGTRLLLTGPLNVRFDCLVQSGLLDSDWFWVPSAINLQMDRPGQRIQLRKDSPIAQLVPIGEPLECRDIALLDITDHAASLAMWKGYLADKYPGHQGWGDWSAPLPAPRAGVYRQWVRARSQCPAHSDRTGADIGGGLP
jgi:hypothetical protein